MIGALLWVCGAMAGVPLFSLGLDVLAGRFIKARKGWDDDAA